MKKTLGSRLRNLFSVGSGSNDFFEQLEDALVEADLGASLTMRISSQLRKSGRFHSKEDLFGALRTLLKEVLIETPVELVGGKLNVFLILGVNGVGKTTNLAKLAHRFADETGKDSIVVAAGDTFRAAAVEQLETHASRLGVRIVKQGTGADAAAVVYDAVQSAVSRGGRVVLADTAGRMHNRSDLVAELEKIHGVVARIAENAVYRKILVIDATTGQNAMRQAEMFGNAVGVDSLVLAKYDSSARGGILVPIAQEYGIGCSFLGIGEGYGDLVSFSAENYLDELLAI